MPLVRISLRPEAHAGRVHLVSEAVHQALVDTIGVPPADRFQVITEHPVGLVYDPGYLGIARTDGVVVVQITISTGRTLEQKKALFARIARLLQERAQVRPEDVFVNLVEVAKENWSFGNGIAQYAP